MADNAGSIEPPEHRALIAWTSRTTGRVRTARTHYDPTPVTGHLLALALAQRDGSVPPSEISHEEISAAAKRREEERLEKARVAAEEAKRLEEELKEQARLAAEAAAAEISDPPLPLKGNLDEEAAQPVFRVNIS